MLRHLSLYRSFLKLRFKTLLTYRVDFILGSVASSIMQASTFLALFFILRQIGNLSGWSISELQLLYGSMLISLSLNQMFADNLWAMTYFVRSGKLDTFLTRPINPLFHILADRFNHVGIGDFLTGSALVILALGNLPQITLFAALYWLLSVILGGLIFFSLNLLCSTSAFWLLDSVTITRVVFDNHQFAKYPLDIFPYVLNVTLTFLLPYGLAAFHPIAFLLGKPQALPPLVPIAIIIVLTAVSIGIWWRLLPNYASTGT